MELNHRLQWLRRVGILCVAVTVVLMASGAWVKANAAGLSCPDWPTCYGKWLPPFPSMETEGQFAGIQGPGIDGAEAYTQAQVLYEWAHRLIVSILLVPLAAFVALSFRRHELTFALQRLPLAALLLYFGQAALGALTVVTGNPPWATTLHLITATTFILLLTIGTCFAFLQPLPPPKPTPPPRPASLIQVPVERRIDFVYNDDQGRNAE
jgi:heme a synthase